ncbi:MAG TPA: DUF72 domain-containing protein [Dehalococcoidia bacterium]|nr:DUF72 domain-containing protein [Dehalococcoidia bacterium]
MSSHILIGTASWTDQSLLKSGRFYPPDVKTPEERLRFYALQFPFVEVDSTYYSLEMEESARAWAERTPDDFVFDVKPFRIFTGHQTPPKMLPAPVRESLGELPEGKRNWYYQDIGEAERDELWSYFRRTLAPLREAGKLGAVVFQFPPWFMPNAESKRHILECAGRLEGVRVAVEYRSKYWFDDGGARRTLAFLREHGLALVVVDGPQGFRSSVPPVWEATDPELAVVRLHGRNRQTWEKPDLRSASERFNYLYGRSELREVASHVRELAERAREVHVTFNNNYEDNAQANARQLMSMLAEDARMASAAS